MQRAVTTYNTAASALDPPKPVIDWNTVSHYKFLEEFPLLRNTSQDLTGIWWALPAVRETMKQWRKICRAHEEIIHCNVEICHLHTSIVNEEENFCRICLQSMALGPIQGPVKEFITKRSLIKGRFFHKITQIYNLKDVSGMASPGVRQLSGMYLIYIKYLSIFILPFHHQDKEMDDENTTTDPNIEKSRCHKNIHPNSETIVGGSSQPLVAGENDTGDNTDSEDENYQEGIVNMLDFVSELQ